ncbi:hypothetical protein LguiA_006906 [Lonicera macranthoides]
MAVQAILSGSFIPPKTSREEFNLPNFAYTFNSAVPTATSSLRPALKIYP